MDFWEVPDAFSEVIYRFTALSSWEDFLAQITVTWLEVALVLSPVVNLSGFNGPLLTSKRSRKKDRA